MPRTDGIDVSKWQGAINWTQVKTSGITWAATRIWDRSTGKADATFTRNRTEMAFCRTRLLYHYLTPGNIVGQAADILTAVGPLAVGEGIMCDAEGSITEPEVFDWCSRIEAATGRPVAVYTGRFVDGGRIWSSTRLFNGYRPRIFAAYQDETTAIRTAAPYLWDVWQWSSTGSVPGIVGNVDLDQVDNPVIFDRACGRSSVAIVSRSEGGVVPPDHTTVKVSRPAKWLLVHHTGATGWPKPGWSDYQHMKALQSFSTGAGKTWEYNYVITHPTGMIWEQAGEYKASHCQNANEWSYGVQINQASSAGLPPKVVIDAFRWLRHHLVETGQLTADHQCVPHYRLRATFCSATDLAEPPRESWGSPTGEGSLGNVRPELLVPWTPPPPEPIPQPPQPTPPPSEDEEMPYAVMCHPAYPDDNYALFVSGSVRRMDGNAGELAFYKSKAVPLVTFKDAVEVNRYRALAG